MAESPCPYSRSVSHWLAFSRGWNSSSIGRNIATASRLNQSPIPAAVNARLNRSGVLGEGEREDRGGHSRADVGAEQQRDGVREGERTRPDRGDGDRGRRRRGLDQDGDENAYPERDERSVSEAKERVRGILVEQTEAAAHDAHRADQQVDKPGGAEPRRQASPAFQLRRFCRHGLAIEIVARQRLAAGAHRILPASP